DDLAIEDQVVLACQADQALQVGVGDGHIVPVAGREAEPAAAAATSASCQATPEATYTVEAPFAE
ncbi:hypothetical protein SB782_36155, partial [Brevibacillus sp. SIMBA_076]